MELLGYLGAVIIGISLGFLGGGGSILAVPLLVYFFMISATTATSYSLFVVGVTSLVGFVRAARAQQVSYKSLVGFAIPSFLGVLLVRRILLPKIPQDISALGFWISKDSLVLMAFAIVMLLASLAMIRPQNNKDSSTQERWWVFSAKAFGVGAVTGFVGAGGGFLIVPALVVMNRLPMKLAVGTSLGIIAFNSLLGFVSDALGGIAIDYLFVLKLSALAVLGILVGFRWGQNTSEAKLKPFFGYFVLIVGALIFISQFSY